jgi:peptide/nickel transport system substrate-binding protein
MRTRIVLCAALLVGASSSVLCLAEHGPFADQIVFDVRTSVDAALRDVAAGTTDVLWSGISADALYGLDQAMLSQFEVYAAPANWDSFILNPYPGVAPYIARNVDTGVETFNPFAIQAVRFAMHYLVDRGMICNQILHGGAEPSIISVAPSAPGAFTLYLEASKLGLTVNGNEAKAIADVTKAIEAAAALPAMTGRLMKTPTTDTASSVGYWWTFDGQPVSIIGLIRVDDARVRRPIGQYLAAQIEKCGIHVDRQLRNGSYSVPTTYSTDPARMLWGFYTEGWGGGGTNKWWEDNIAQFYSMWNAGEYPGGGVAGWWQYVDQRSEELTQKLVSGQFSTMDQYWSMMAEAAKLGLQDSIRIFLLQEVVYFVANKAAFENRFLYGLGDGLNNLSAYTMVPVNKGRPVRCTQLSPPGSLFMNAWDPVGVMGFNDLHAANIVQECSDPVGQNSPGAAVETPIFCTWSKVRTNIDFSTSPAGVGAIQVPKESVSWDPAAETWKSRAGEVAWAQADYKLADAQFHDGTSFSLLDVAAAEGFTRNWATEKYAGDPEYDSAYSQTVTPGLAYIHGSIYNYATQTVTNFFDYNFPDANRVALAGAPRIWVQATNSGQGVKWTVIEALGKLVASGPSASGTVYGFTRMPGVTEVDVLVPSCVADIRAELVALRDQKYIPPYLAAGFAAMGLTGNDAADMYRKAISFIDTYGHAYISNGGYIITKFDPASNQMTLTANRNPKYPFSGQRWLDLFQVGMARVDGVVPPFAVAAGQDATVEIDVSQATYPYGVFEPATGEKTGVQLIFVGPTQVTVMAREVKPGRYQAVIPGSATKGIAAGAYTIVAVATPGSGLPVAFSSSLLVD